MRGEDASTLAHSSARAGSPPHARGRPRSSRTTSPAGRITPACAGKTSCMNARRTESPDHPRMRGEDGEFVVDWAVGAWITPACAGKTVAGLSKGGGGSDHPRMRGEDNPISSTKSSAIGSPPHARGRRRRRCLRIGLLRITPACAGKTPPPSRSGSRSEDHPRMRGEDLLWAGRRFARLGSPPHARGRLVALAGFPAFVRITPACAGKTCSDLVGRSAPGDHPRMRGEDSNGIAFRVLTAGSPPHARGRPPSFLLAILLARITPACAGKTRKPPARQGTGGDHPRMRGEDSRTLFRSPGRGGSPPHARGRRRRRRRSCG